MSSSGEKSWGDYFVVATADLDKATLHANIRFELHKSVTETTHVINDFIFGQPKNHKGKWHVFFRGHTEPLATDFRQQMRN